MDFLAILKGPMHTLWWVIPILLVGALLRSPLFRSMIGEINDSGPELSDWIRKGTLTPLFR